MHGHFGPRDLTNVLLSLASPHAPDAADTVETLRRLEWKDAGVEGEQLVAHRRLEGLQELAKDKWPGR